jgi:hypothetical protein
MARDRSLPVHPAEMVSLRQLTSGWFPGDALRLNTAACLEPLSGAFRFDDSQPFPGIASTAG